MLINRRFVVADNDSHAFMQPAMSMRVALLVARLAEHQLVVLAVLAGPGGDKLRTGVANHFLGNIAHQRRARLEPVFLLRGFELLQELVAL